MNEYKIITEIENVDIEKWKRFVLSHPNGNIFQIPEICLAYSNIKNFQPKIIVITRNNNVVGSLVYIIQQESSGVLKFLSSRSIIMGGPLAEDNDLEIIDLILSEYKKRIKNKVIYSQFRNLFDFSFANEVFEKNKILYEKHLDILIDITQTPEKIKSNISKNKRGNISKSLNKGTQFLEITDKERFHQCIQLINKTYKRIGLPCPKDEYFLKFYDELSHKGILKTFALEVEGKLIATRLELCLKDTIYDWWAGADDNYKNYYPNDVLPYQILIWGHQNGYKQFDFGGAGKPGVPYGVRDHKMKFGGELVEYGRYEMVHKPLLMSMGKAGLLIYKKLKQYVGS